MPSQLRSWTKALTHRLLVTSTILIASYVLTGSLSDALKIGAPDFFGKLFLFYGHERLWLQSTMSRELVMFWKMVSWKVIANMITMALTWWATGRLDAALKMGPIVAINMVTYAGHEFLWESVLAETEEVEEDKVKKS
jgi:adenylylsulfate kinase